VEIRRVTKIEPVIVGAVTSFMQTIAVEDSPWVHPMTDTARATFLERGWDGEPPRLYVGEQDGGIVAVGHLELPERDNRHLAWADVKVHPDHRRHGLGTQLIEHLAEESRLAGRTTLGADGWESEATLAFAARHGLELKSQAIQRIQYPQRLDLALVAKQASEAAVAAKGYELVRVVGRTPDELVEEVVEITAAINDAPTDDLDIEDEVFSVERLRDYEDANEKRGRTYSIYARHTPSGRLAGKTVVLVENDRPHLAHQHDTSVVREHRGHRLGMLLKASMVQWLAEVEPQLEEISTWNAESNDHMIGVNEALGYVVLGRNLEFQRDLEPTRG
jgi:GNAT superfamily N-acetyltransferase